MSPGFAAAVCEGFYESLEHLLSRDLPTSTRRTLVELQEQTGRAIETLDKQCSDASESEQQGAER